jgi:hypothetical protein
MSDDSNPTRGRKTPNRLKQEEFVTEYFANGGRKRQAGEKLGIGWTTVKTWFATDPVFKEMVEDFKESWRDNLRAVALKRATEKSDTALIFMLKALDPEMYDDNIRKLRWLADRGMKDPDAIPTISAVLIRGDGPEIPRIDEDKLIDGLRLEQ